MTDNKSSKKKKVPRRILIPVVDSELAQMLHVGERKMDMFPRFDEIANRKITEWWVT